MFVVVVILIYVVLSCFIVLKFRFENVDIHTLAFGDFLHGQESDQAAATFSGSL